jgi:hypothetical protein
MSTSRGRRAVGGDDRYRHIEMALLDESLQ